MRSQFIFKSEVVLDRVSQKRSDGNRNAELAPFLVEHVFRQIFEVLVREFRRNLFQRRHLAGLGQVWIVQAELGSGRRKRDRLRDFGEDSLVLIFDFVDGRGVAALKIEVNKVIYF